MSIKNKVQDYILRFQEKRLAKPNRCLVCKRSSHFRWHGSYVRTLITIGQIYVLPINRLLCSSCHHSFAGSSRFSVGDLNIGLLKNMLINESDSNSIVLEKLGISIAGLVNLTEEQAIIAFNAILEMNDFYTKVDEKNLSLSSEIKQLLAKAKTLGKVGKSLEKQELLLLNMGLLLAIYPHYSVKTRFALLPGFIVKFHRYARDTILFALRCLNRDYALGNEKGGSESAIWANNPSIQARFSRGTDSLRTLLLA